MSRRLSASDSLTHLSSQVRLEEQVIPNLSRSASQFTLSNGCDIDNKFYKLRNGVNLMKNLGDLIEISRAQQYSVTVQKINAVFGLINSQPGEISSAALALIDRIASFSPYFISSAFHIQHVQILYNLLPSESATKALGKIVSSFGDFAVHVANLETFPKLVNSFLKAKKLPLFSWFISCFVNHREVYDVILPIYQENIFTFAACDDPAVKKHSIDAMRVLAMQGEEMLQFVAENADIGSIIENWPQEYSSLKVYFRFLSLLAEHMELNGIEKSIQYALESDTTEVMIPALDLLTNSIHESLQMDTFIDVLFEIYENNPFMMVHERVCTVLCQIFPYMTSDKKKIFIDKGFMEVLEQHIECVGEDGIPALSSAYDYASTQSLGDIIETIELIANEYDISYECLAVSM